MKQVDCEALIIGGGPAGSTAAAVLAAHGRDVVLLERERFPRYHVGESLMPYCYFTLERLGVLDKLRASAYPRKHSVQFVTTDGRVSAPFYFFQHYKHESATTWQVWRSEFDQMLLENAASKGAKLHVGTAARELIEQDGQVVGVLAGNERDGLTEFRAPVTIDASGRDGFAINRKDWRIRDPKLSKISLWTYYRGAKRDPGLDEGATTVAYLPDRGWFWYIPLTDDTVSVGITAERDYLYRDGKQAPDVIFDREIGNNDWIADHLASGKRCDEFRVTGDYSYRSKHCAADGLVLTGDAFAFLDPVFSSGVFLALRGGELCADAVADALGRGRCSADAFADYGRYIAAGMEAMRKLVYAFYDTTFSFGKLIKTHPKLQGDLTDCLIGDLFRDFDELFVGVGKFAGLPEPLSYGQPLRTVACESST